MLDQLKLTQNLMNELDKKTESSIHRAERVFRAIDPNDITNYDLICFCIEFLALEAQNNFRYLLIPVKHLAELHFHAHYLRAQNGTSEDSKMDRTFSGP